MLRVLLLEDSRNDEKIIAAQLQARGLRHEMHRVDARASFEAALDGFRPDVVLADYNVPGFPGDEALVLTRERRPELPFLFVSGALGEHAAVELLKRGATDYVLKDRLERLAPSIERALREANDKRERAEAERKLLERERTLSTLMSNLPGMVFRARDEPPWELEFSSEGCLGLTGYSPEELGPGGVVTFAALIHPDDAPRVTADAEAARARGGQFTTTYRIRTRDGRERWVWVRATYQPRSGDQHGIVEGFVTDITAQKAAEAEVLRRIEFEQQLIGIVSHDLKNPLNAILLGATTLLKREGMDELGTRLARRIVASTERAARMVNDLLDFTQARLGAGLPVELREVDVRDVLGPLLDEFEQTHADRNLVFRAPDAVTAHVDAARVTQLVTNLVQNALAYSPKETAVTIGVAADGDDVVIEVHNVGEPIPPEKLRDIFEPFQRGARGASPSMRSIGLGLFIVDSIARAHEGTVTVRSSADEGTTFVARLPRHPNRKDPS